MSCMFIPCPDDERSLRNLHEFNFRLKVLKYLDVPHLNGLKAKQSNLPLVPSGHTVKYTFGRLNIHVSAVEQIACERTSF